MTGHDGSNSHERTLNLGARTGPHEGAPKPEEAGAVGIALTIRERAMLAVDRHPLPPALSRREPEERGGREDGGLGQRDGDRNDQQSRHVHPAFIVSASTPRATGKTFAVVGAL